MQSRSITPVSSKTREFSSLVHEITINQYMELTATRVVQTIWFMDEILLPSYLFSQKSQNSFPPSFIIRPQHVGHRHNFLFTIKQSPI